MSTDMSLPPQYDGVSIDDTASDLLRSIEYMHGTAHPELENNSFWPDYPYLYEMGDQEQMLQSIYASPAARAEDIAPPPAWNGAPSAAGTFTPSSTNLVTC
jgi:hypothetical protein